MRNFAGLALLGLAFSGSIMVATTAHAQSTKWIAHQFPYRTISGTVLAEAAKFVNDNCAPRDASGIAGQVMMNADGTYVTYVWCRVDQSQTRWRGDVRDTTAKWYDDVADHLTLGNQSVIGIVRGVKGNTIFVLRDD